MSKVQSTRTSKNKLSEKNSKSWVLLTIIYGIFLMWIYGMTTIYFPEPIHVGFGQYFDIAIGVLFFGLIFYGIIIAILIRTINRRRRR